MLSYENPTFVGRVAMERFFFTEPHYASFQDMLTRYKAMAPRDHTPPIHKTSERAYLATIADIILDLMRERYPLETMVWEQEQADEQ